MTTWTWRIKTMYTVQSPSPDYVVTAFYVYTGNQDGTTSSLEGSVKFASVQQSSFIPYDQLTEETVIGWVQSSLGEEGIAALQLSIQGRIDQFLNPPVTPAVASLPW
jgi:hypothetical protein